MKVLTVKEDSLSLSALIDKMDILYPLTPRLIVQYTKTRYHWKILEEAAKLMVRTLRQVYPKTY